MKHNNQIEIVLIALATGVGSIAHAADGSPTEEVIVEATRVEKPVTDIPAAVGVLDSADVQLGRQQLGLDEALVKIPGVFLQNRFNFSQDLRIAIRGFGARGNFGIRGVKILVDGIPSTLPDGQGQVDSIDLASVGQVEVIRGAASSLYGNASGGVINITTEQPSDHPFLEARTGFGEFGYRKHQLKAGAQHQHYDFLLSGSYLDLDGFRDQSRVENRNLNGRFRFFLEDGAEIGVVANAFDSPIAEDPGGLTSTQAESDPSAARDVNERFNAGEEIDQQKLGLTYRRPLGDSREIIARVYGLWRDFENRLPFENGGIVRFDRNFYGGGLQYSQSSRLAGFDNRITVGFDLDRQQDDRQRFNNLAGSRGNLTLDQTEEVTSLGAFIQSEIVLSPKLEITLGLRADRIEFDVADQFLGDGDDSGERDLDEISPLLGAVLRLTERINLYANVSTAFETPTTTEFANPSGGGFNPDLDPQTATNFELGVKGVITDKVLEFDLAVFRIEVDDEITPFELAQFPGRTFFRNAGQSTRNGVEAAFRYQPFGGLTIGASYTLADYEFDEFVVDDNDFSGNRLPGIPKNLFHGEVDYRGPGGIYAVGDLLWVDDFFADNANSAEIDSYTVVNLRAGVQRRFGQWHVNPFLGINNLFDEDYPANVRINAFGGRFLEPAPDRNVYGGITVRRDY